jgi:hypothetical protein
VLIVAIEFLALRYREPRFPASIQRLAFLGDAFYLPVLLYVGSSRGITMTRYTVVLAAVALGIASFLAAWTYIISP